MQSPKNVSEMQKKLFEAGIIDEFGNKLYSLRDKAPTFYSQMARTIDGIKQDKIGAASVVSYLRGRGVKAEEIKWSGIEEWLQGKKSVTKAELQEFAAGSMLQIEEQENGSKYRDFYDAVYNLTGIHVTRQDFIGLVHGNVDGGVQKVTEMLKSEGVSDEDVERIVGLYKEALKRNGEDVAANKYKEMAKQELGHSSQLLDMACAATGDGPEAAAMKMMCGWIREEAEEDKADIMRMLDHVGAW